MEEIEPSVIERISHNVANGNHTDAVDLFRQIPVQNRAAAALDLLVYLTPARVRRLVEAVA